MNTILTSNISLKNAVALLAVLLGSSLIFAQTAMAQLPTGGDVESVIIHDLQSADYTSQIRWNGRRDVLSYIPWDATIIYVQNGKRKTHRFSGNKVKVVSNGLAQSYATPLSAADLRAGNLNFFTTYISVCSQLAKHMVHINYTWKHRSLKLDFYKDYRISLSGSGDSADIILTKKSTLRGTMKNEGDALTCQAEFRKN